MGNGLFAHMPSRGRGRVGIEPITMEQFRKGATAPTDTTIGTTPTVPGLKFDATNELASLTHIMPLDWDKSQNTSLVLVWSLAANETTADVLDVTLDYTALVLGATGQGVAATSSQVLATTVLTTAEGLAIGDIYITIMTMTPGDSNNGYADGDGTIGFAMEFHLTNLTDVADVDLIAGRMAYTKLY